MSQSGIGGGGNAREYAAAPVVVGVQGGGRVRLHAVVICAHKLRPARCTHMHQYAYPPMEWMQ